MWSAESTRSLIVGLFALTGRRELTAAQLVALAGPCGVTATNLKSHLTRMVADGNLLRDERPRASTYRPSERRRRIMDAIDARLRPDPDPWDGAWLVLLIRLPGGRSERERVRRRLEFDGFRRFGRDAFLRPAWPLPWAIETATAHAGRTAGIQFRADPVDPAERERLAGLYDLDQLHRRARRLARELEHRAARLGSPPRAWAERIALGERVVRLVSEDPFLPAELWGERTGMRELVAVHRRFEKTVTPLTEAFVGEALDGRGRNPGAARSVAREAARA
jgi:DNA-binding transcriptional regulator PaaX